ncbi:MAG: phenylalanine--tRNA ligase subunit alpha [Thermoanaerobacterales bacterium]|nr:phenylalanine--tRNA ligase subunit alpha [Bacillota bacterium]MDI6907513.1 phenylalanine--tRNA ligase subunit alpha [Thermoanaerobacterales bacterium]
MLDELNQIAVRARELLDTADSLESLEELRIRLLGKKGELTRFLRGLNGLPAEDRPRVGRRANEVKEEIEAILAARAAELKEAHRAARLNAERIDVTLPGTPLGVGTRHPLTLVREEIEEIFLGMGYTIVEGPEVETDYYNFEALNFPKDHPARDMQDTFLVDENLLLRTHTSPVQVRTFEKTAPHVPVRIIAPGRVYRRDDDATHSPMFHQVEGLAVDVNITFSDLKGTLAEFARKMFSPATRVRFRPSYFPFTEPSAEVDISCVICHGSGCRVCSHTGWLEILGAGMIHPRVLEVSGYDSEKVSGFAFGMGIERITMLKYGVDNMRLFFENDIRFLRQFARIV